MNFKQAGNLSLIATLGIMIVGLFLQPTSFILILLIAITILDLYLFNAKQKVFETKKKTLTQSDMMDIQKKMAVGDAKGAVLLALNRAYDLSEQDIAAMSPDQVRKLMDNLGKT